MRIPHSSEQGSLFTRLRRWLDAVPSQTGLEREQARLIQVLLLGLCAILLCSATLTLIAVPLTESPTREANLSNTVTCLIATGLVAIPLVLLRRGRLALAAAILVGLLEAPALLAIWIAGPERAWAGVLALTLPLALAALVLGRRALIVVTLVSIVGVTLSAVRHAPMTSLDSANAPSISLMFALLTGVLALFLDRFGATFRSTLRERHDAALATLQQALASRENDVALLAREMARQREERSILLRRFHALAEGYPGVIAVFNPDLVYELLAGRQIASLGIDPAELRGQRLGVNVSDPELQEMMVERAKRALNGEPVSYTQPFGNRIYEVRMVALRDQHGAVTGGMMITTDITERARTEEKLRESEARLAGIVGSAMDAIITIDHEQRIVLANRAAEQVFGARAEDLVGQSLDVLIPERLRAAHRRHVAAFGKSGVTTRAMGVTPDLWGRRANGEEFPIEASISQVTVGGEKLYTAIVRDITERRRQERLLKESEERYRLIAEHSTDLIQLIDLEAEGAIRYASPSHSQLLGLPQIALFGPGVEQWVESEDRDLAAQLWADLLERGEAAGTVRVRHMDGTVRFLDLAARALTTEGRRLAVVVGRDVTERKKIEARYLQSQRMESVGRLAGGIAHDFNNLLTGILGYVELCLLDSTLRPEMVADLEEIQKAAQRATMLTRQLLTFARQQVIEPRVVNLNEVLVGTGHLLRRLIGADVELVILPDERLAPVRVDAGQIEQVIVNLAINARDAMPSGGRLTIETANVTLDEEYRRTHTYVLPGDYVMIAVSDTGTGMPEEVVEHLFEPFFTTKEPGKGTGLGMATVYGIVKQHGGYVWVYSEVGVGTSVKVYLPRVDAPLDDAEVVVDTVMPRGDETILVVEDEEQVRRFVTRLLRTLGYQVLEAASGDEAIATLIAHLPQRVDLVLTDVIMPRMGGRALAEKLASIVPNTKVLFMSGYTDDIIMKAGILAEEVHFLQKPFNSPTLARKVRQVLDTPEHPKQADQPS